MTPEHDTLCVTRDHAVLADGQWLGCDCALIANVTQRTIHEMIQTLKEMTR